MSTAAGASPRASCTAPAAVAAIAARIGAADVRGERRQVVRCPGRRVQVRHRDRDVHDRGEQSSTLEPAVSDLGHGETERSERPVGVALREAQQGHPRLRVEADLASLREALLRAREVADAPPDLPGLVEGLCRPHRIEGHQLLRGPRRFGFGLRPRAAEPRDLRTVDAAHPGERRLGREGLAPGPGGLAPLVRPADVGDLQTGADHVAVDDPREVRTQLAGRRRSSSPRRAAPRRGRSHPRGSAGCPPCGSPSRSGRRRGTAGRAPRRDRSSSCAVDRSPLKRATVASTMSRNPWPTPSGTSSACRLAFISQPAPTAGSPRMKWSMLRRAAIAAACSASPADSEAGVGALPRGDRLVDLGEPPCGVGEGLELGRGQFRRVAVAEGRVGLGPRLRARGVARVGDALDAVSHNLSP